MPIRVMVRVLIACLGCLTTGLAGVAGADTGGGANNVVIAQNTADGRFFSRSGVMVAQNPGETVANSNLAIAESTDCAGCHTVSVAMQVVVVENESPNDFRPANAATAVNGNCTSCQTYAFAYQYIVQPGTPVTLSASAQQGIAGIRLRVRDAAASGAPFYELKAVLDGLCNELAGVVTSDLGLTDARPCTDSSDQKQQ
ncbi:MAG TPA: hypothetical protein VHF27_12995 [Acidimicrobiales bacterium]|nr:hypothetical protein [Acidimicrobiales bacterium]